MRDILLHQHTAGGERERDEEEGSSPTAVTLIHSWGWSPYGLITSQKSYLLNTVTKTSKFQHELWSKHLNHLNTNTFTYSAMDGFIAETHSEKCIVSWFHCCVTVRVCLHKLWRLQLQKMIGPMGSLLYI